MKASRWIYRAAGLALLAVCCAFLVHSILNYAAEVPAPHWDAASACGLAAALGLYVLSLAVSGAGWHTLLSAAGERAAAQRVIALSLIAQPAKYLPGNVGHYLGRLALAGREGLRLSVVSATLALETVLAPFAGILFAVAALLASGTTLPIVLRRAALGLLAAAGLLAVAAWLSGRRRLAALLRLPPDWRPPSTASLTRAGGFYLLAFFLWSAIAWLLAHALLGIAEPRPVATAGVLAAGWIAGFLTPGAPAGLGVREAVLVAGLSPLLGTSPSLALAGWFRLVTTLGDAAGLGLGLLLRRAASPTGYSPGSSGS